MSQPETCTLPESSFSQLGVNETLLKSLEDSGYAYPTPIQTQAIPILLEGRDLLGQAQTGTGKTAAFALPLLQNLDLSSNHSQVLVLTPTRELAIQVAEAFERYASGMKGLRVAAIYGGQDYLVQFRKLDRGTQVVVGTPGRVMDHMRRESLKLDNLRCLVLDEADEMLRMGFADDVEWILQAAPAKRQIALFSATLPETIRRIAQKYLHNPAEITIQQRTATADTVRQRYVIAAPSHKEQALSRILEAEPIDGVLVFVKTKSSTEPLAEFLTHAGHRAAALNGDIPQKQRERIIENLRSGKINVVVATDVAARGLDVQRISHVINYDLPFDSEAYVHRIGRTGRAGRTGEAILFVGPRERGKLKRLEYATRQKIEPMDFPSNRAINKQRVARFHERMTASLTHPELETFASIVEQYRREHDVPLEKIATALAAMAHGKKALLIKDDFKPSEFVQEHRSDREHGKSTERRPSRERSSRNMEAHGRDRSKPKLEFRSDEPMETYRIEVGHAHDVKPGNIVGAIANEAGIDSAFIGRIQIFDSYSTVDLPGGMPPALLESLGKAKIAGRPIKIKPLVEGTPRSNSRSRSNDKRREAPHKAKRRQEPVSPV